MLESCSALAAVLSGSGRDGADRKRRLALGELPLESLIHVGVQRGAAAAATAALEALLRGPLPHSPRSAVRRGEHLALRLAPDQYWIRTPDASLAKRLRDALGAETASVVSLDAARTRVVISGAAARPLLERLVAVDLDDSRFPIGDFAQTPIHHVGGLLYRAAAELYEFWALRTFAASTWEVIEDAAQAFGYDLLEAFP